MIRCRHVRFDALAVIVVFLGVDLPAEETPESKARSEVSIRVTEALKDKLPKYSPLAPAQPASSGETREVPEGTLVLPTVTVRTKGLPDVPLDTWLTAKARQEQAIEQAMKDHPGLKIGNLFGSNTGIALTMQQEKREAKKKAALTDTVQRIGLGDSPEDRAIKGLLRGATQRSRVDWLAGPPGK